MGLRELLRSWRRPSRGVVLALGGGGARGLAHLGVLALLEEEEIPVVAIAGTSAGAVIGAMWLALGSTEAVQQRWHEFMEAGLLPASLPDSRLARDVTSRDSVLFQFARKLRTGAYIALSLNRRSLVEQGELDRAIEFLVPDVDVQSLPVPFAAAATDFHSGELTVLRRGPLRLAVAASSAVPGAVPPYEINGQPLIDGGVVADVPVAVARSLARRPVVAVEVGEEPGPEDPDEMTVPRAILRAGILTHRALVGHLTAGAALTIRPDVGSIHWSEFGRYQEAIAAGRKAAEAHRHRLRALGVRRRAGDREDYPNPAS